MSGKKKTKKTVNYKTAKDFLKEYPKPPPEHTYELKMERRLKRIINNQEKKNKKQWLIHDMLGDWHKIIFERPKIFMSFDIRQPF